MALTISITRRNTMGHQHVVSGTIAFDSSYATGGEAMAPSALGLSTIDLMLVESTKGLTYEYDYTNSKLKAYAQGALVGTAGSATMDDFPVTAGPGVTGSTSLSLASGSGTVTWGTLKEVPSTNDLSTITGVRFVAIGV